MAVGDVWKLAVQFRNPFCAIETCAIMTWHAIDVGGIGGANELATSAYQGIVSLMTQLSADVVAEGVYLTKLLPVAGPETAHAFPIALPGGQGSAVHPTDVAVEVIKRTGRRGRAYWGRDYVPWTTVGQSSTTVDGNLATTAINNIQHGFVLFGAGLLAGSGAGDSWQDAVYTSRARNIAPSATAITSYQAWPTYRSLGQRARARTACPPFSVVPKGTIVATIGPTYLFKADGSSIADGRIMRFQSDADPRVGTPGHLLTGFSNVGYDDSWWNTKWVSAHFYGAVGLPGVPANCRPEPMPNQPIGVLAGQAAEALFPSFHHYGDSAAGDQIYAYSNERGYGRREFEAPAALSAATLHIQLVDDGQVWINGTQVLAESGFIFRTGLCPPIQEFNVLPLINLGGLNCLGLVAHQYAEPPIGTDAGQPICNIDGCFREDLGYPKPDIIHHVTLYAADWTPATMLAILRLVE